MNQKYCKWILEVISSIYVFIILLIFPLVIGPRGYENVLEVKHYFYLYASIIYILSIIIVILYFLIVKRINYFKNIRLKKIHYLIILFLFINVLSCAFSPYKNYNLLLGLGRGEGLLIISLYVLTFIFISLFYKFEKKHLTNISISVILVSLIAILEYLGYNPFNIYKGASGPFNMSYMTTLGNKDIISAYYTIMLSVSAFSFIFLKNTKKENSIHILSLIMGIFIFALIEVDSGLVAFCISLAIAIPFILSNSEYLKKTMLVGSFTIFAFMINYILNPIYRYSTHIYKLEPQFDKYSLIMLITIILFLISYKFINKYNYKIINTKKFIKRFYLLYPVVGLLGLTVLYYEDFNIPVLSDAREILHGNFDDELGTYRLFLWKRSIKLVGDYPILGTGPDTFSYRFMSRYWLDVLKLDNKITINDTAANVYLTMLVNIGILGLLSYLIFIGYFLKKAIDKVKTKDMLALVFLISIICFLVQDFFNLSVVIVTPIFYTILGIAYCYIDTKK